MSFTSSFATVLERVEDVSPSEMFGETAQGYDYGQYALYKKYKADNQTDVYPTDEQLMDSYSTDDE